MQYLIETRHIPLILKVDRGVTRTYIDASHAIHKNMRGHRGQVATDGKGAAYVDSKKLSVNTTSSSTSKLVAAGEGLITQNIMVLTFQNLSRRQ